MPSPDSAAPGGNDAQIAYWNDRAGANWVAFQDTLDAIFTPLTQAALTQAAAQPGEAVIDIGCGCGATMIDLARQVGPAGSVLGLDVSVPMSAHARARIAGAGLANARIEIGDAAAYPFPPGATDLIFSRFGVMFFADPAAAFATLRHAMKPGGRLVFACWRPQAENSWFALPLATARPLLPPQPPPDPDAPGPFAFADPARVRAILAQAGWRDMAIDRVDVPMQIAGPGEVARAAEVLMSVGSLARVLVEADPALRPAVRAALEPVLAAHDGPEGITLGGSVWLVSARP